VPQQPKYAAACCTACMHAAARAPWRTVPVRVVLYCNVKAWRGGTRPGRRVVVTAAGLSFLPSAAARPPRRRRRKKQSSSSLVGRCCWVAPLPADAARLLLLQPSSSVRPGYAQRRPAAAAHHHRSSTSSIPFLECGALVPAIIAVSTPSAGP